MTNREKNKLVKEANEKLKLIIFEYVRFANLSPKDKKQLYFEMRQRWFDECKRADRKFGKNTLNKEAFKEMIDKHFVKYTKLMFPKKFVFFMRFRKHSYLK